MGVAIMSHTFERYGVKGIPLFSDAVERAHCRFKVGLVGLWGIYKSYQCPQWVCALRQADCWGYETRTLHSQNHNWRGGKGAGITVGTDSLPEGSKVARHQALKGHARSHFRVQRCVLTLQDFLAQGKAWDHSGYLQGNPPPEHG